MEPKHTHTGGSNVGRDLAYVGPEPALAWSRLESSQHAPPLTSVSRGEVSEQWQVGARQRTEDSVKIKF